MKVLAEDVVRTLTTPLKQHGPCHLVHITAGYELAGSCLRWTNEVYRVSRYNHSWSFRSYDAALAKWEGLTAFQASLATNPA